MEQVELSEAADDSAGIEIKVKEKYMVELLWWTFLAHCNNNSTEIVF